MENNQQYPNRIWVYNRDGKFEVRDSNIVTGNIQYNRIGLSPDFYVFLHSHYETGEYLEADFICNGFKVNVQDDVKYLNEDILGLITKKQLNLDTWYTPIFEWEEGVCVLVDLLPEEDEKSIVDDLVKSLEKAKYLLNLYNPKANLSAQFKNQCILEIDATLNRAKDY